MHGFGSAWGCNSPGRLDKTGGYLGRCPCLPAGQLDLDERTLGEMTLAPSKNLVVRHGGMQRSWAVIEFPQTHVRARVRAPSPPTITVWPRSGLQVCALGRDC